MLGDIQDGVEHLLVCERLTLPRCTEQVWRDPFVLKSLREFHLRTE